MRLGFTARELGGNAIISLVMSAVMSSVMIGVNAGFGSGYLRAVVTSWMLGALVSFPTALIVVPPVIRWQSRYRTASAEAPR